LRIRRPETQTIRARKGEKDKDNGHGLWNGTKSANGHQNGNGNGHLEKSTLIAGSEKTEKEISDSSTTTTADGGETSTATTPVPWTKTLPVLLCQVSFFQTMAGPIGFSALRHISYPTMVLGKVRSTTL
jgi:hypothetical protein